MRVVFHNGDSTSHSLHVHGVHPAADELLLVMGGYDLNNDGRMWAIRPMSSTAPWRR